MSVAITNLFLCVLMAAGGRFAYGVAAGIVFRVAFDL
jgi:hypothetical protein